MATKERLYELIEVLNDANLAYEQQNKEIMSDFEYDALYDELLRLENTLGIYPENSPSQKVGHEVVSGLSKVAHQTPLLSLNKTKEVQELVEFLKEGEGLLSWKLDGLTVVLIYEDGRLFAAITRGNGHVGEDIIHNARFFVNIPQLIDTKERLVIRGEGIITYSEFNRINLAEDEKYKNPRNLCAGTIRQLDSREAARRKIQYYAFSLLDGPTFGEKSQSLEFLSSLGFELAEYRKVSAENIYESVEYFRNKVESIDFATDGLVLTYDDVSFSRSLGATSKFPRDSIAFKWEDEVAKTKLIGIEWHTSRTGLINPIAIFEPVELAGTTVSRASLHNLSIVEGLKLNIGDEISVYKANMIIPQVLENYTKTGPMSPPKNCMLCKAPAIIKEENGIKTLHCSNAECKARIIGSIAHFVGRDAMNIEGFSKQTIEKFLDFGYISNISDIYDLENFEQQITAQKGFGKKSFQNLIDTIKRSKNPALPNFIYALGIDNVGLAGAKLLCKHFDNDMEAIRNAKIEDMLDIDGFGEIIATSVQDYFNNTQNLKVIDKLLSQLTFKEEDSKNTSQKLANMTFVITGDLEQFANRKALVQEIESHGGKTAGSVSKNTNFLINNNYQSASSKNKKANELDIPIITEMQFLEMLGGD